MVRLRYAFQTETRLYLLTDFYAGGALSSAARAEGANGRIPADAARFYAHYDPRRQTLYLSLSFSRRERLADAKGFTCLFVCVFEAL